MYKQGSSQITGEKVWLIKQPIRRLNLYGQELVFQKERYAQKRSKLSNGVVEYIHLSIIFINTAIVSQRKSLLYSEILAPELI